MLAFGMLAVAVVGVAVGWWVAGGNRTLEPDVAATRQEVTQEPEDSGTDTDADVTDDATAPPQQPTVTDARTWRRVTHEDGVFGRPGSPRMRSVTAGGPGLVAVGYDMGRDRAAAVWTSSDGTSWQRVPHDEAVFGGAELQKMFSVTVGGPGLVAVGEDAGRETAAVWTSSDGLSWQRVPHDESAFGGTGRQSMWSVTAGGPGLVAVGDDTGQQTAAVWTSTDGTSWQRVPHSETVFGGTDRQVMFSVTAGGPGLVAVGDDEGRRAAAVWTSSDGLSWQRVPHDESAFGGTGLQSMLSVTAGGPGLVAVGADMGRRAAAVWTSSDGVDWQRVAHDESIFGGANVVLMPSVTAGGPGLVAVGIDMGRDRAAVWTSSDGTSWQRVPHDESAFGGAGQQQMLSVTVGGPGLVAVGDDEGREAAAVWTAP